LRSDDFARSRRRQCFTGLVACERAIQFPHRQRPHIRQRRIRRRLDHNLNACRRVDRGDPLDIADTRNFKKDGARVFAIAHAARPITYLAQTAFNAATKRSISSSSWNGEGVMRRRSVPRGTVG